MRPLFTTTTGLIGVMLRAIRANFFGLPKDSRYLFPAEQTNAKHLSDKTAYNWLQTAMAKADIKGEMDFHGLRRTYVRLAKKMGRDMKWIQEVTGDTARTVLENYDGYSTEEMNERNENEGGILSNVKKSRRDEE